MIPRHTQIAVALTLVGIFGAGFYMLHLNNQSKEGATAISGGSLAPPVTGPAEPVALYIAYDGDGVMRRRSTTAALPSEPAARAREVLRVLLAEYLQRNSSHPMGERAEVTDVFLVNGSIAVVDVNRAFAEGHRSGVGVEALTIGSFVGTLAVNNPEIKQVKFLVEGRERETLAGHADLMTLYDVAQVDQLVRSLQ
jgi:hypothetical protein